MSFDRRDFFQAVFASGALAALLGSERNAAAATKALADTPETEAPGNAFTFWSHYYSGHTSGAEHDLFKNLIPKAPRGGADPERQINFLNYDANNKNLRFPQQVHPEELLDYPGDVAVTMKVGGVRLSQEDQETFRNANAANLRLDMAQNKNLLNISDKLAWASLAALFPSNAGKLPPLQDLSFSPSANNNMLLPGGSGMLGVNVSMTHRESNFYKILGGLVTEMDRFSPIMGLPAISVTALDGVYKLWGYIENRTIFLFQTPAPQQVFATQPARTQAKTTQGLNIVEGDYVLVPQKHIPLLNNRLSDYKMAQSYLVPKDAPDSASVYELAKKMEPDFSYVTANISVTPVVQYGAEVPTPSGAKSSGSSSSSSSAAKKSTSSVSSATKKP